MRVVIVEDAEQVAEWASARIAELVTRQPKVVLGLATGGTPVQTYRKLVERSRAGLDVSQVTTFNLDEYFRVAATEPHSYRSFMNEHLFIPAGIPLAQTHVLDGMTTDVGGECRSFEAKIQRAGGIDFQLLGIGRDGHIGFNEPGSSLSSRTRWMLIAEETREDNAVYFGGIDRVPCSALTMGVATILESRQILLLAVGAKKADAVAAMIEGPVTNQVTATALQHHSNTIVVMDQDAAKKLTRRRYYQESEVRRVEFGLGSY